MPTLKPGQVLAGYRVVAFHGRGGMGEIFRAEQLSIGREVALKLMNPELVRKDPSFAQRFREEAQAAGQLSHPNIVGVHDVGSVRLGKVELHYFSMEFIEGENLREKLERDGPLPLDLVGTVMTGMSDALAYAEGRRMVHRDIKPENIMVTVDGRVKLADFGLAKEADEDADGVDDGERKGKRKVMGTPRYMSPEQARARPLDGRSDQYSLGATLFHLLTGSPPYTHDKPRDLMKAHAFEPTPDPNEIRRVPPLWRDLCMTLMAKDPADRYPDAKALCEAVSQAVTGGRATRSRRRAGTLASGTHAPGQATKGGGNRVLPLALGAGGLVAGLAIAGFLLAGSRSGRPATPTRPDPETTVPQPSDPVDLAARQEERARELLESLPDDDIDAALARLEGPQGLGNTYYPEDSPARQLLDDRARELRAERERRHQEAVRSAEAKIEEAILIARTGRIREARQAMSRITARERALVGDRMAAIRQAIDQQLTATLAEAEQAIANAEDDSSLDDIVARAEAAGIGGPHRDRLLDHVRQRRQALAATAAAAASEIEERLAAAWNDVTERLERFRSDGHRLPDYRGMASTLRFARRNLAGTPGEAALASLAKALNDAQRLEEALDQHLASGPEIEVVFAAERHRATCTGRDDGRIQATIGSHRDRPRTSLRIDDAELPLVLLLRAAAKTQGIPSPALLAWLWAWRQEARASDLGQRERPPDLVAALERIGSGVQTAAPAADDDDPPVADGPVIPGGRVTIDDAGKRRAVYIFAQAGADWTADFTPQAAVAVVGSTLRWAVEGAHLTQQEAEIATLAWNQRLRAPCLIDLDLDLDYADKGAYLLVGLRQGGRLWRLALYRGSGNKQFVGGFQTGARGTFQREPKPIEADRWYDDGKVVLDLLSDGSLTLTIDGTPLRGRDGRAHVYQLDPAQEVELVFQVIQPGGHSEIGLRRLEAREE